MVKCEAPEVCINGKCQIDQAASASKVTTFNSYNNVNAADCKKNYYIN
jgi:hypothetical protein